MRVRNTACSMVLAPPSRKTSVQLTVSPQASHSATWMSVLVSSYSPPLTRRLVTFLIMMELWPC